MTTRAFWYIIAALAISVSCSLAQWSSVSALSGEDVFSLACKTDGSLFAGTYNDGIYRTTDYGTSWSLVEGQMNGIYEVYSIAFDSSGNVFAGTHQEGLLKSTDNGHGWTQVLGSPLISGDIHAVATTPSGAIIASYYGALYRSTDHGGSWTEVRSGSALYSIACHGANAYSCGTSDGFCYSSDSGATWQWLSGSSGLGSSPYVVAVQPSGYLFVGTGGYGVYLSTDGGSHWTARNNKLTDFHINTLSISVAGTLYVGTPSGVFYSSDSGANWNAANGGLTNLNVLALTFDPHGTIYAGISTGKETGGLWKANTPLPIQLSSFTSVVTGGSITLQWKTVSEINNYGFEIQRSHSSNDGFVTIAGSFVAGNATTIQEHTYRYTISSPPSGTWYYRLKQSDLDGTVSYSDAIAVNAEGVPAQFSLGQNYPNPFNPSTSIGYSLPSAANASIAVYDLLGQKVATLVDGYQEAGNHTAMWDARSFPSGVYCVRMVVADNLAKTLYTATSRIILVK